MNTVDYLNMLTTNNLGIWFLGIVIPAAGAVVASVSFCLKRAN